MPHFFSDSSIGFLERHQFIPRCRHNKPSRCGSVPTDTLSLMDVMLHTNSIFTVFYCLKEIEGIMCSGDDTHGEDSVPSSSWRTKEEITYDPMKHMLLDMRDFDGGLSEEVLAPLLLSFLDFYLDQSIDLMSIRRALRAFFETTPYLCELDHMESIKPYPLYSNVALLLLNLTKSLLRCESMGWVLLKKVGEEECRREKPMLPWLCSRAEHATREPTWYWKIAQHPHTISNLIGVASIYRSSRRKDRGDDDAITLSHPAFSVSRKRERAFDEPSLSHKGESVGSCGIVPLPFEVQEIILEYLSPRALSVALVVCRPWWTLVRRSPVMRFYRYAGRVITRVFLSFLEEDWGQAWVRVDPLTTLRRLSLHHKHLSYIERRLHLFRLMLYDSSSVNQRRFTACLSENFLLNSCEWKLFGGLWNAVELEVKLFPCIAPKETSLFSLFNNWLEAVAATTVPCSSSSSVSGRSLPQWAAHVQLRYLSMWIGQTYHLFPLLSELVTGRSVLIGAANLSPEASP